MKQKVEKNRKLIDISGDLPEEHELRDKLARAATRLAAKDNLIQVRIGNEHAHAVFFSLRDIRSVFSNKFLCPALFLSE